MLSFFFLFFNTGALGTSKSESSSESDVFELEVGIFAVDVEGLAEALEGRAGGKAGRLACPSLRRDV